jgi:hypothetical protein
MVWSCNTHGRDEKCTKNVAREMQGKKSLENPRRRWKYNIRMYLNHRDIECKLALSGSEYSAVDDCNVSVLTM